MEHYSSVVYMVGIIVHPNEALKFIQKMSLESSAEVRESLMNSSRTQEITELEDRCAELVKKHGPSCLNEQPKANLLPAVSVLLLLHFEVLAQW
ncbi:PPR superfamily protein, putative [Medicago truncatula]|nr:PPR superfamily protein, putative [Medicago truncatula]